MDTFLHVVFSIRIVLFATMTNDYHGCILPFPPLTTILAPHLRKPSPPSFIMFITIQSIRRHKNKLFHTILKVPVPVL